MKDQWKNTRNYTQSLESYRKVFELLVKELIKKEKEKIERMKKTINGVQNKN